MKTFYIFAPMRCERTISAYKNYFKDFIGTLSDTQKTPEKEINKAIQLKKEYYAGKQ